MKNIFVGIFVLALAGFAWAAPIATINLTATIKPFGVTTSEALPCASVEVYALRPQYASGEAKYLIAVGPIDYNGKAVIPVYMWPYIFYGAFQPGKSKFSCIIIFSWKGHMYNYIRNGVLTVNTNFSVKLSENSQQKPMGCNLIW